MGFLCGGVEFFCEKGEQGGPPGLRAVGRAFGGGVKDEESSEAQEVSVKPGFKGKPGGERRRLRNGEPFQ